jgi:hypothetical protein
MPFPKNFYGVGRYTQIIHRGCVVEDSMIFHCLAIEARIPKLLCGVVASAAAAKAGFRREPKGCPDLKKRPMGGALFAR